MCLIHFIVKGRKNDVGTILHQEITDCIARQTRILVFPSLVMLLCQQRGIVPHAGEEILKSKGPINEASIKRMTRGKDTLILKEAETSKTRQGKAKAHSKRTNLKGETSLWRKLKDVCKMVNSINNRQIKLVATVKDMEISQNLFYTYTRAWSNSIVATLGQLSPFPLLEFLVFPSIIHNYDLSSSDDDLEDRDRPVASPPIVLFEDGIFADQEDIVVEKEVDAVEVEVVAKEEIVAEKEEVAKNKKEKEEENFVEKVVTTPESVGVNINNLE
ncbi:hypothetical protein PVK06_020188 [Gossypium arboreum]|uniref:Uncharacterized protein n=1 Tax=Gossypium arboreum TaxID=29729 RepID=A0ABR0PLW6_GOSAR|nr:hypothetical protein PVK06_020188 [Gossypium arboreum]